MARQREREGGEREQQVSLTGPAERGAHEGGRERRGYAPRPISTAVASQSTRGEPREWTGARRGAEGGVKSRQHANTPRPPDSHRAWGCVCALQSLHRALLRAAPRSPPKSRDEAVWPSLPPPLPPPRFCLNGSPATATRGSGRTGGWSRVGARGAVWVLSRQQRCSPWRSARETSTEGKGASWLDQARALSRRPPRASVQLLISPT